MRGRVLAGVVVAAAVVLGGGKGEAASQKDWSACYAISDFKRAIPACTRIIGDDGEKGRGHSRAYYHRALAYVAAKDTKRALADLGHSIRIDPAFSYAYAARASVHYKVGSFDKALADYNEAIRQTPETDLFFAGNYRWRGQVYEAKGDLDRAIADYGEAIRREPSNTSVSMYLAVRADAFRAKGDLDRAVADYDEAIRKDKDNAPALTGRALALIGKGDTARAVADLRAALAIEAVTDDDKKAQEMARKTLAEIEAEQPGAVADAEAAETAAASREKDRADCRSAEPELNIAGCTRVVADTGLPAAERADAYVRRGDAHNHKNDLDRALADYDEAIRLDPASATAYEKRGDVYRDKRKLERAIADFSEAIRLDPERAAAYRARGSAHLARRDFKPAIADFTAAIRIDPGGSLGYRGRGDTYRAMGDFDRAIADYSEVVRLHPVSPGPYYLRGQAFLDTGNLDRAIADFDEVIRLKPSYLPALVLTYRGNAYLMRGEYGRAISDYGEALRIDPTAVHARVGRADAYRESGDHDRALADYDEAIRLAPQYPAAYAGRGLSHFARGDTAPAAADFRAALARPASDRPGRSAHATARGKLAEIEGGPVDAPSVASGAAPQTETQAQAAVTEAAPAAAAPAAKQPVAVPAGRRIALVIGNAAYRSVPALKNPARDTEAVAAAFRRLGFAEVTLLHDLAKADMERALVDFADRAQGADWAVVYYAGHGIEMDGSNYLIPVDARLKQDRHVRLEALELDDVLDAAGGARTLRLVILDACRDNPFAAQMTRTAASRSIGRGLARVEPAAGEYIAFAARDGQVALDGDGELSPFASALLTHLHEPGLDLDLMFRRVRDSVMTSTGGAQQPFTYGSLPGVALSFAPTQ